MFVALVILALLIVFLLFVWSKFSLRVNHIIRDHRDRIENNKKAKILE